MSTEAWSAEGEAHYDDISFSAMGLWSCCKGPPDKKKLHGSDEDRFQVERDFLFRIDKINANFDDQLERVFLEFEIGGKTETETFEMASGTNKTTKIKDPQGVEREVNIPELTIKKKVYILKEPAARFYTRSIRQIKSKKKVQWNAHVFSGEWRGNYIDLGEEYLTVRVWNKQVIGANLLVGEARRSLLDIASGKMDLTMNVLKTTQFKHRKEIIASLCFKMEFQEKHTFTIEFRDWEVCAKDLDSYHHAPSYHCFNIPLTHALEIKINRSRSSALDRVNLLMNEIFCCYHADRATLPLYPNTNVPAGQIRGRSSKQSRREVLYPGTRAWLEDEVLYLDYVVGALCMQCWCRRSIARKEVPLQGVLDYGYVITDLRDDPPPLPLICGYQGESGQRSWSLKGVIDSTMEKDVLYEQQGNIDPDTEATFLDKFGKKIRAGKVNINFTLLHDTTFLVVKVIRAKGLYIPSVDEYKETLNPNVYVEWLQVRKQTRTIMDNQDPYWDDEVYFKIPDSRNLHRIRALSFDEFAPEFRESTLTLSIWDNDYLSKAPMGYCEIPFSEIYYERKPMNMITFTNTSGHPQEHLVYMAKKPLKTPFALVDSGADDNEQDDSRIDADPRRFIEFQIYFDRPDRDVIPLIPKVEEEEKKAKTVDREDIKPLDDKMYRRAKSFWENALQLAPYRKNRYFPFAGRDEYTGKCYYLPLFIKPITPPKDVRKFHDLLYFIYSIQLVRRPHVPIDVDGVIVDHEKMHSADRDLWVWCDPYFFLDKRKGDVNDHAILLCNFLLGLSDQGGASSQSEATTTNFEAYVCIGTVLVKKRHPAPHVWVMTKEIIAGEKIVRFWETTNGKSYELRGNDLFDDLQEAGAPRKESKESKDEKDEKEGEAKEKEGEVEGEPSPPGSVEDSKRKHRSGKSKKRDKTKDKDKKDTDELPEAKRRSTDSESSSDDDSAAERDLAMLHMTQDQPEKVDEDIDYNIADARRVARVEHTKAIGKQKRALLDDNTVPKLEEVKKQRKRQCPYKTLDVVFNHKYLYGNLQKPDPELIKYNFNDSKRWAVFSKKNVEDYFYLKNIKHFYPDKALVSIKAPKTETEEIVKVIKDRIKDSITTYREHYAHARTYWIDKFDFQAAENRTAEEYIEDRLDWEYTNGGGLRSGALMEEKDGQPRLKDDFRQEWRARILSFAPTTYTFREKLLHFKHSQANKIVEHIRLMCKELLIISPVCKPRYAVAVRVYRLPASISPVRVFICVLHEQPK